MFGGSDQYKIVAVDDDPFQLGLMKKFLQDQDYDLTPVPDPAMAIDVLLDDPPQLILMDISMGSISGLDLARQIKEIPGLSEIPICFLTAQNEVTNIAEAFSVGAADYISKPIVGEELRYRINAQHQKYLKKQDYELEQLEIQIKLERRYELLEMINYLLASAMKDAPLDELLSECISVIVSSSIAHFEPKGSIYLFDEETETLRLTSHHQISNEAVNNCLVSKMGECICGQAAAEKRVILASSEESLKGAKPHCQISGHYCLPLIEKDTLLGVLNIYVPLGHEPSEYEERFLTIISNSIARIIYTKRMQEESLKLSKQLVEAEKQSSLGFLSTGIAHELNNPLAGIMGYARMLKENTKDSNNIVYLSDKIYGLSERMKSIIEQLRMFVRQSRDGDWEAVNLNRLIQDSFQLFNTQLEELNVKIDFQICDQICQVWGHKAYLDNAMHHLITNSIEAFIKLEEERDKTLYVRLSIEGDQIQFLFKDNACGMSLEVIDNICTPFFTTKEAGEGAGLGMSIVLGVVENHKGKLEVESEWGLGSTFKINFPLLEMEESVEPEAQEDEPEVPAPQMRMSKKPVVLVVDDEPEVSEVVSFYIEDHFRPIEENNPGKAIEMIKENKYDLILTDVKMPEFTGLDIAKNAKKYQPETPVVVMSGFSKEDEMVKGVLEAGGRGLINKPFGDPDEIVAFLMKFLNSSD